MTRVFLGLSLAGAVLAAALPAAAEPTLLTGPELAAQRGGIATPFGVDIGFAATVSAYVDGELALQTRLTWTDQGVMTQRAGSLAPSLAAALPSGVTSASLQGLDGGSTQFIQQLTSDRIVGAIVNSSSNQNLRQDVDVTLTLPQLPQLQQQINASQISSRLQSSLGLALQAGAGGSR
jgi:hypothetical protein